MRINRRNLLIGIVILAGSVAASPLLAPQNSGLDAKLAAIEKAVESKRRELKIQGISLVIVKDDHAVMMKGFGLRNVRANLPVTPDTLFAIGSCTKAFTALAAVIGVDEGKLSLDTSVKKYLPYFKLKDPTADSQVSMRDLMSHRTGLDEDHRIPRTGHRSRAEVIQAEMATSPKSAFREAFHYNNIIFSAGGEAVAGAMHSNWEEIVSSRIFKPLGMNATNTSIQEMQRSSDYSIGYAKGGSKVQHMLDLTIIAPAGAINSNARDMERWLRFMLAGGIWEGRRLVSEAAFQELTAKNIQIKSGLYYGLGWGVTAIKGHPLITHNGGVAGFTSVVDWLPDLKLGWVILLNVEDDDPSGNAIRNIIVNNLIEG
jgi:CubicO group peptidase (beta-lactamase class C family)